MPRVNGKRKDRQTDRQESSMCTFVTGTRALLKSREDASIASTGATPVWQAN